ncbi:CBS domain-containing protein [Shewanella sp. 202IG2-18]|uniref:CBS domain-containing protein n=1 Tax=Parashewanella hymeniacidonis TaxID=2807618 RepID=UPI0019618647|nr:CBS domain-containing protein [Parashewanella hymeniacidonis]MBM7070465.1 CBS domain-containing protein [Parashewanella hymeniacidonis]
MRKNDPISKIMSTDVHAIQDGQNLSDVRHIMCNSSVHHVPVLNGKKLVGLISFTDMMKLNLVTGQANEYTADVIIDQQFSVTDVMSKDLKTITTKDNIRTAAKLLSEGDFHSLPVINEERELVGIITSTDLISYLAELY